MTLLAALSTGTVGAPAARNLLPADFDLPVWNRIRETLTHDKATVGERGAEVAGAGQRT